MAPDPLSERLAEMVREVAIDVRAVLADLEAAEGDLDHRQLHGAALAARSAGDTFMRWSGYMAREYGFAGPYSSAPKGASLVVEKAMRSGFVPAKEGGE